MDRATLKHDENIRRVAKACRGLMQEIRETEEHLQSLRESLEGTEQELRYLEID